MLNAEPDAGLKLMNREIMTWAKIKSQMLNWQSHPGAPTWLFFYDILEKAKLMDTEDKSVGVRLQRENRGLSGP